MDSSYTDLISKLDSLKGDVRKKALSKSLRAMGKVIQAAIVLRAPEQSDTPHGDLPPGALKADIRVRVHIAQDVNAGTDTDRVTIAPGKQTNYVANFIEFGHANRPRTKPSKKPRTDRTQPHPFVRPAFDASQQEAVDVFQATMTAEIEKAFHDA